MEIVRFVSFVVRLGLLLALLYYVPLLNLLVPVLSGLAFAHFGLAELARLRQDGVRS